MSSIEKNGVSASIIVFGEVLYDCFPDGRRILGGAPFNVAWSLCGFGKSPLFVSAVGMDRDGAEIQSRMKDFGLRLDGLQEKQSVATGEVYVTIKDDEPSYEICENRAWDEIEDFRISASDLLYHGLLALRSEASHRTLKNMVQRSDARRFFDINLRPPYVDMDVLKQWIREVDWLKLNIDELQLLMDNPEISITNCDEALAELKEKFSIKNIVLTGGSDGAVLFGEYGHEKVTPAPSPESFTDTVGAGDAFSAATIAGILDQLPPREIIERAGRFASKVCGLRGATTSNKDFYKYK